ncbi:MAG: hypothetical protein HOO91_17720 [Bacteroidales bacterium]|nr:hypothetical protein [Bacteroidales bacterium]
MQTLTITFTTSVFLLIIILIMISVVTIYSYEMARRLFFKSKHFTAENNPFNLLSIKTLLTTFIDSLTVSNSKMEASIEELKTCQYEIIDQIVNQKKADTPKKVESNALTLTDYEAFGIYCFAWFDGFLWRVRCQLVTNTPTCKKAQEVDLPGQFDSRSDAEINALIFAESLHVCSVHELIKMGS